MSKCAQYDDTCDCAACSDDRDKRVLEVDFQGLQVSGKRFTERFDLGSVSENSRAAVAVAWKRSANIVGQRFLCKTTLDKFAAMHGHEYGSQSAKPGEGK